MNATDSAPRPRRRLLPFLLLSTLILAGLVAAAPWIAAPLVQGRLAAEIEERTGAQATIGKLSLAWPGHARLEQLVLRDAEGFEHARVGSLECDLDLGSALRGAYTVRARVSGVALTVEQDAQGSWSFERLLAGPPDPAPPEEPAGGGAGEEPGLPEALRADLELTDLRLNVRRPAGALALQVERSVLRVEGLERPIAVSLTGALSGDGLAPGRLTLEAELPPLAALDVPAGSLQLALGLGGPAQDGGLDLRLEGTGDGARWNGNLALAGRLAPAVALLGDALPLEPGVAVDARVDGRADFALAAAGGELDLELDLSQLAATDAEGAALDLARLGAPRLALTASVDLEAGTAQLAKLVGDLGPITLEGSGRAGGLRGEAVSFEDARLTLDADLDALQAALAPLLELDAGQLAGQLRAQLSAEGAAADSALRGQLFLSDLALGQLRVDGAPLELAARIQVVDGERRLDGRLSCSRLALQLDEARRVEERDLELEFGIALEDPMRDPQLNLRGGFGRVGLARVEPGAERLRATFDLALGPLTESLGGALDLGGLAAEGRLSGDALLESLGEPVVFEAELLAEPLQLSLPRPEGPAHVASEPRVALALRGSFAGQAGVVDLEQVTIESTTLSGSLRGRLGGLAAAEGAEAGAKAPLEVTGLRGALTYVPDRMMAWAGPWLPGRLSGAEPEAVELAFDGPLAALDLAALVGPGQGEVTLGLGGLELFGLRTTGSLRIDKSAGRAALSGDLAANDGSVVLRSRMGGLEDGYGGDVHVQLDAVRAAAGLAPTLGLVHPAFAALETGGDLSGLVDASLDLRWEGELPLELLQAGADLPLERISGRGRLALREAALSGSPFLSQVLELLGEDAQRAFDLGEISFGIEGGRVVYDRPWTWRIDGVETTFSGSLGLDGGLDLDWRVPITEALVRKHKVLKPLLGGQLEVPVRGTALSPRIDFGAVLEGAAREALEAEVRRRTGLGDLLGGIGGGQKAAGQEGVDPAQSNDPALLLREADRLWDAGERKQAAKLYGRIREEFKLSAIYLLHRDKIKERMKAQD